jgi:pyruvate kinase
VISCTLPAALDRLEAGHRVLFDDGRIEAIVKKVDKKRGDHVLGVTHTQKATAKLRAEKGINLPDTATNTPALTEDDVRALAFVVKHTDAVSLPFVSRPDDVRMLHEELDRLGRPGIGVVLKIERRAAFEKLPAAPPRRPAAAAPGGDDRPRRPRGRSGLRAAGGAPGGDLVAL